jgi:hypothetical protein
MTSTAPTRNASLNDLAMILRDQQGRKLDVVAPATSVVSRNGLIRVKGVEAELSEDGVTIVDGEYKPTAVFDEGVSDKLGIPLPYVRRLREQRPDLLDANVNGLLHGRRKVSDGVETEIYPADGRKFLLRLFKGDSGPGVARALLSDSYKPIDNLDVLMAALEGMQQAGQRVEIAGCDLSDRRMYVRVVAPEVRALAPDLLRGYRSPYSGNSGDSNPVVFAGYVLGNSETGGGAFSITPRIVVEVCTNGMTITKDALRSVHLGGKLEEGTINWSAQTQQKSVELVTAKTADAVRTFLQPGYLQKVVEELTERAGTPITKPEEVVKQVARRLQFTEAQQDGILAAFVQGGQMTAGGVMQAVTAHAQLVENPDAAAMLEDKAISAMELAASL